MYCGERCLKCSIYLDPNPKMRVAISRAGICARTIVINTLENLEFKRRAIFKDMVRLEDHSLNARGQVRNRRTMPVNQKFSGV